MKNLNLMVRRILCSVGSIAILVYFVALTAVAEEASKAQALTPLFNGQSLSLEAADADASCGPAAAIPHPTNQGALPQVPSGFEIQLVAAPPLVDYPTLACFDDLGRLYVSEGANVNDLYEVFEKTLPRSIRRLEDS